MLRDKAYDIKGYNLEMDLVLFFHIFEIIIVCFIVDICDLVHDVDAILHLP